MAKETKVSILLESVDQTDIKKKIAKFFKLKKKIRELLDEQAAGFYDPRTATFYLIDLPPATRAASAHRPGDRDLGARGQWRGHDPGAHGRRPRPPRPRRAAHPSAPAAR